MECQSVIFAPLPLYQLFILSAACERVPVVAGEVGVLLPEERVVAGPEAGALVEELETNVHFRFRITKKAPNGASSWLKSLSSTIKTLC